jgi:bacterioferritin-associated ferredoxin
MWICHCRAVTDSHIRAAVGEGARDEDEVGEACGAGTGCGGCRDEVRRLCQEVARAANADVLAVAS